MTALRRTEKLGRGDRGAVAVEFALILIPLMLIVFGIIQFGVVMTQSAALANGARAGARDGVVNIFGGNDCAKVIARAKEAAQTLGMPSANVAVTVKRGTSAGTAATACSSASPATLPCKSTSTASETLYVTTQFTSVSIVPFPALGPFNLSRTGAFRCEYK